ncbi:HNH endonuclease [Paracoccus saliphilus]|uniref:HNH endonuclease n=1 Tax=Paracoccus saliphilus TaxID=405559 RepID=A0AA45W6J3_9RHOB|nr:HNH endonuclease [Paracoccus saliphilus]WCR04394.1 HNH endonuclease [Paracoccus saliphilus]SIT01961.1 HNH endonuclease [Paracoccus saliphilus]
MIETPQSFVTRQECEKVTYQNGFRRPHGEIEGWQRYSSTTAQGSIWLARETTGAWLLALDHAGVIAEIGMETFDAAGPGLARFRFASLALLYGLMPRVYELAASLPDAPLQEFLHRTKNLPRTTEAERNVVQRVGQNIFRERLTKYWQGRCPLSGVGDNALLRASHIKPWRDCENDDERLDVHNGLLLSALWDAAFDSGLVTFDDDGIPIFSECLSERARAGLHFGNCLDLTDNHRKFLVWHRKYVFEATDYRATGG